MKADLVVRELLTDAEVSRVSVGTKSARSVEKVMCGMLINMNTERFYIDDSEVCAAIIRRRELHKLNAGRKK